MRKISLYLKICGFGLLIFIWDYIFINYRELPAIIPIHYNLSGDPDGYGPKFTLWMLAAVATFVYLLLFLVAKNPQTPFLNIPKSMKDEKKKSELFINILNFIIMLIFSVLTYESIAVGKGEVPALSSLSNYLLGAVALLVLIMVLSNRKKTDNYSENILS